MPPQFLPRWWCAGNGRCRTTALVCRPHGGLSRGGLLSRGCPSFSSPPVLATTHPVPIRLSSPPAALVALSFDAAPARPCPPRPSLCAAALSAAPVLVRRGLVRRAPPFPACPRLPPVLVTARPRPKRQYVSCHHKTALTYRARTTYCTHLLTLPFAKQEQSRSSGLLSPPSVKQ